MAKILVIDDSYLITTLLAPSLLANAFEVLMATDGKAGLKLAQEQQPDVILLDLDLPRMNGHDVCQQLKNDRRTSDIPVIFLTGNGSTQEKIRALDSGGVDYITKPFDLSELLARVRVALRLKFMFDLLARKAMIDGLTGLGNRAYLNQRLTGEFSIAQRTGRPLCCVMMDVDHFKSINDNYGHPRGDEALQCIAQVLQDQARAEDILCRYGGEEFCLLLANTDSAGAVIFAERLRGAIEGMKVPGLPDTTFTASFGVADMAVAASNIVACADQALYQAKRKGRNRVEVYTPENAPALVRIHAEG